MPNHVVICRMCAAYITDDVTGHVCANALEWNPGRKLGVGATDDQIERRIAHIVLYGGSASDVVREFADACVKYGRPV